MEKDKAFLLWFDQLERKDVAIAGFFFIYVR